jgi:uncharacterized cofD-like protein
MERKKIVVLGGGTGTFTVLSGLKSHPVDLSAVVSIADNGGSTGILRDELGVLPPGDIRQCLVALSPDDTILRSLFNYRFFEGSLAGHNFGNIFLSALEKLSGDPLSAVKEAQRILNVCGQVIPVAATASNLFAELEDGTVVEGEHAIEQMDGQQAAIARCFLSPSVSANPEALQAIREADAIVFSPGDFYTSLIPVLLTDGVSQALAESKGKKIYAMNLATKRGQTDGYTASSLCRIVQEYAAPAKLDAVLVNTFPIPEEVRDRYLQAGDAMIKDDLNGEPFQVVRAPLIAQNLHQPVKGDNLRRSLLRHDPDLLAQQIVRLL